jgi:hypothetical protein
MKKNIYPLAAIIIFLIVSCKTTSVYIEVLKPAEINIPGKHEKITVINRSLPGKGSKGGNFVEGLVTGEGIHQDRNASDNCVGNFAVTVNEAPKYVTNNGDNFELYGTGTKEWPLPLNWDTVKKITSYYNTDLLIVLETFDSDSRYFSRVENYTTTVDGKKVDKQRYIEGLEIYIDAGWRIYDPEKKQIIDQQTFRDAKAWEYKDDVKEEASRKLPSKRNAVEQAGAFAGYMYAKRISPTWATESRTIFRTKDPQMKEAIKLVKKSNWKEAYKIWDKLKNSADVKMSAYALHNIALYYEFNDDVDLALKYANEAYQKYNNDHTARLINILTGRQAEINRLNEQLN